MAKKIANKLYYCFYFVFTLAFSWLLLNVVFANRHFSYNPIWVLLLAVLWGAAVYGLNKAADKASFFLQKREKLCLCVALAALAVTELFFYYESATYPVQDFERVYTGAYNYTIAGIIEDPYLDYFYKFPNNLPITVALQFVFRVVYKLGITNFLVVGAILNFACYAATYFFVYLCCRELLGVQWGFLALGVLYLCVPLHCYISVFYTDTTTMLFAPLALYLYIKAVKCEKTLMRLATFAAFGIALGFGIQIKYSVVIVVVAIFIDMLINRRFKMLGLAAACAFGGFMLWGAVFSSFIYGHILDKNIAPDKATPMISWVMMGLNGDGTHNAPDNYIIWDKPTKEEKSNEAKRVLVARLQEYGPLEYIKFLNQKGVRSFGSGNFNAGSIVAGAPFRQTFMVECYTPGGQYYNIAEHIFEGYHVMLLSFVIIGSAIALKRRKYKCAVPILSIFGLYLFLLIWEAGQRYLLNYMGMFVIAAVFGVYNYVHAHCHCTSAFDTPIKSPREGTI
ncbi:MAG: glycosyltransferase family 39 protein [Oscillospiraceae bacterium]